MDKLRMGFVGAGPVGQGAHLQHYLSNPACEVVALAEIRADLRAKIQNRWGIPQGFATHRELLEAHRSGACRLDGIVAIQQFAQHGQIVPELLTAGLPVLTEKPVARSSEAADLILAAERANPGSRVVVAYHKRSDPATTWVRAKMRELEQTQALGALRYLRVTMPPSDYIAGGLLNTVSSASGGYSDQVVWDAPPQGLSPQEITDHEQFVNYYIHQVNLLRFLLNEDYRVTHVDPTGVVMHVQSDSGIPALLEMAPWSNTLEWQEAALICYEKGWIRLRLVAPMSLSRPGEVELNLDPGDGVTPLTIRPSLPHVSAMQQQAANFLNLLRGEPTELCSAQEARKDLEIAGDYIRQMARYKETA